MGLSLFHKRHPAALPARAQSSQQTLSTSFCERLVSSVLDSAKEFSTIQTETKGTVRVGSHSPAPLPQRNQHFRLQSPHGAAPPRVRGQSGEWGVGSRWARNEAKGCSPLHDDQQALPPRVQVLIDVHDPHDVWALGGPPVQLHLAAGLGTVLKHLQAKRLLRDRGGGWLPRHLGLLGAWPAPTDTPIDTPSPPHTAAPPPAPLGNFPCTAPPSPALEFSAPLSALKETSG